MEDGDVRFGHEDAQGHLREVISKIAAKTHPSTDEGVTVTPNHTRPGWWHFDVNGRSVRWMARGRVTVAVGWKYGRPVVTKADMAIIRRFVDGEDRLRRREAALGDTTDMPLWSLTMDIVALHLLRWACPDPDMCISNGDDGNSHVWFRGLDSLEGHLTIGNGTVEHMPLSHHTESGMLTLAGPGMDGRRLCRVILAGIQVPETVIDDLPGRDVGDVIAHPAFKGMPTIAITRAANAPEGLILHYRRRLAAIAPAPEGVDTSWRPRC